jgi:hypothetical protein
MDESRKEDAAPAPVNEDESPEMKASGGEGADVPFDSSNFDFSLFDYSKSHPDRQTPSSDGEDTWWFSEGGSCSYRDPRKRRSKKTKSMPNSPERNPAYTPRPSVKRPRAPTPKADSEVKAAAKKKAAEAKVSKAKAAAEAKAAAKAVVKAKKDEAKAAAKAKKDEAKAAAKVKADVAKSRANEAKAVAKTEAKAAAKVKVAKAKAAAMAEAAAKAEAAEAKSPTAADAKATEAKAVDDLEAADAKAPTAAEAKSATAAEAKSATAAEAKAPTAADAKSPIAADAKAPREDSGAESSRRRSRNKERTAFETTSASGGESADESPKKKSRQVDDTAKAAEPVQEFESESDSHLSRGKIAKRSIHFFGRGAKVVPVKKEKKAKEVEPVEDALAKAKRLRDQRAARNKRYKAKLEEAAKLQVNEEIEYEASWKPSSIDGIIPAAIGVSFPTRWEAHRHARGVAASLGLHQGINVHQENEKITVTCNCCFSKLVYVRRSTGAFDIIKVHVHADECFGAVNGTCTAAYKSFHVSRIFISSYAKNPNLKTSEMSQRVKDMRIFKSMPGDHFFKAMKAALKLHFMAERKVQMEALPQLAKLYTECGHTVELKIIDGKAMKAIRYKAALFIFNQLKKVQKVPKDEVFSREMVDVTDIDDDGEYYGGLLVRFSTAVYLITGHSTFSTDACHMEGIGPQSFGSLFNIVCYDCNRNLNVLIYMHDVGCESYETWLRFFVELQKLEGIDQPETFIVADLEKGMAKAFNETFTYATKFGDERHIKKALNACVGSKEKAKALAIYSRMLREPSKERVEDLFKTLPKNAQIYLGNFDRKCETFLSTRATSNSHHNSVLLFSGLFSAYANLKQNIVTSQGTESMNGADLRVGLRAVEPQVFLAAAFQETKRRWRRAKAQAEGCIEPVPPRVQKVLLTAAFYRCIFHCYI